MIWKKFWIFDKVKDMIKHESNQYAYNNNKI